VGRAGLKHATNGLRVAGCVDQLMDNRDYPTASPPFFIRRMGLPSPVRALKLEQPFASQLAESLALFDYKGHSIWTLRPEAGVHPTS
jgi:hypothetical protein